jgi:hypothetical protein
MSVTKPTLKPELLDDAPPDELVVLPDAAGALPLLELVLLLLLLLLLPHAASPSASTAVARASRPEGLILPDTRSPFRKTECATITPTADLFPLA